MLEEKRFFLDVLNDISNGDLASQKRKETEESVCASAAKKRAGSVTHAAYEKLTRENNQLKKEIQAYRDNWMCECRLLISEW